MFDLPPDDDKTRNPYQPPQPPVDERFGAETPRPVADQRNEPQWWAVGLILLFLGIPALLILAFGWFAG